jgi:hypothetical protein
VGDLRRVSAFRAHSNRSTGPPEPLHEVPARFAALGWCGGWGRAPLAWPTRERKPPPQCRATSCAPAAPEVRRARARRAYNAPQAANGCGCRRRPQGAAQRGPKHARRELERGHPAGAASTRGPP